MKSKAKYYYIATVLLIILALIPMTNNLFKHKNNTQTIPRKVLFGNPDKTNVKLSNNGKYLSYVSSLEGVLNIWVAPLDDVSQASPITSDKGRGIKNYFWAYDNQHILYMQDDNGDENFRIYSYDLNSKLSKLITPEKAVKAEIYKLSDKLPNVVMVGLNNRDPRFFDIYKLSINDGKLELVYENNKFTDFNLDHDLNIRFASLTTQDGGVEYFKPGGGHNWELFLKISPEDAMTTGIANFVKSNSQVYLLDSRDRDTAALAFLNLNNGKIEQIAEDSKADVNIFTIHPTEKTVQAVTVNYDRVYYRVLDKAIQEDMDYLQGANKGDVHIIDRALNDQVWLVAYENDTTPLQYYTYERDTKTLGYLFSNNEEMEKYELSPMFPVVIKSRDGLDLVSYITFPMGMSIDDMTPKSPLPLVLYVHGGPWSRDEWGLNSVHQWLANRGYAVLSVNFRGSTGFGKSFINAGDMEWGGKMHDDLIDAVNWAIGQKITDPKKVAIMGGSYGGYASLVGLTFTPEVFACGIDIVGPSNLLTFIQSVPPYWKPILDVFKKRIGPWETEKDQEFLKQRSPLTFADKITKPLFIAQGANDPRVKKAESDQIYHLLVGKKLPVAYALYSDEGHGFMRAENRLSFYALAEQFLAKVLGGKVEAIGEDLKGANLLLNEQPISNCKEAEDIINASALKVD